jgi:PPOX class probable FMN-dependent enzyme
VITSIEALSALVGTPSELARKKQLATLDAHCRAVIARSPFVLVATSGASGQCDVSPKGDAPGFVQVLDDRHLLIPDRPGNKRLDGMRNILENPHVGLIFLVPRRGETLRVNGRASIVRDAELLDRCTVQGKPPLLGIGVQVEECFLHCAKAIIRSNLWNPERWTSAEGLASAAQMFWDQTQPADCTVEDLAHRLEDGYRTRLY